MLIFKQHSTTTTTGSSDRSMENGGRSSGARTHTSPLLHEFPPPCCPPDTKIGTKFGRAATGRRKPVLTTPRSPADHPPAAGKTANTARMRGAAATRQECACTGPFGPHEQFVIYFTIGFFSARVLFARHFDNRLTCNNVPKTYRAQHRNGDTCATVCG